MHKVGTCLVWSFGAYLGGISRTAICGCHLAVIVVASIRSYQFHPDGRRLICEQFLSFHSDIFETWQVIFKCIALCTCEVW